MTLHDYGCLLPEFFQSYPVPVSESGIFNYTPCLGVWLSSRNFLEGQGGRQNLLLSKFFCYANFSIVFKPFLWMVGGGVA